MKNNVFKDIINGKIILNGALAVVFIHGCVQYFMASPALPTQNEALKKLFKDEISIMDTGTFHEDEIDVKNGQKWLVLKKNDHSVTLEEKMIKLETVYDPVVDEDSKTFSGKRISIDASNPILLIHSTTPLEKKMNIPTVLYQKTQILANEIEVSLNVQDRSFLIQKDDKNLYLKTNGSEQKLPLTTANELYLIWAGDLDGDGKIDLLFDDKVDENIVLNYKLFLSSKAKKSQLVKQAASFKALGC